MLTDCDSFSLAPTTASGQRKQVHYRAMKLPTKNEVILLELPSTDFLLHRITAHVNVRVHLQRLEKPLHFLSVVINRRHDWNHENLPRTDPEWPFARKVFRQDRHEPLEAPNNGTVDHDWPSSARPGRLG